MNCWEIVGLVVSLLGLCIAGRALLDERRQESIEKELPDRPQETNPWRAPLSAVRRQASAVDRYREENWAQRSRAAGGLPIGRGPDPDIPLLDQYLEEQEQERRDRLAEDWDAQEAAFERLYEANAEVVKHMRAGHAHAQKRIRRELVGLAVTVVGTVISSVAG